ncbi:putative lipoprotein, attached to the cytoplasmic membrane [Acinetobacter calcoaceticus]|uniref:MetQ/NlpA family ABC transporter substrate-binding protein n=1 Tax=Acinetobacter calcoaceticus TaxID=471 RepID=UPI0005834176|nr:MetQ/NlpA family ABC transporter substrate-binding protein [Acinetobacter calcoaceticus]GAM30007.1 putative lipoprotein, attached to the cytoplasmic membrane [Acinetobacter calcoaceticus]
MKKLISLFLSMSVVLLAACGKQEGSPQTNQNNDSSQVQTVVIASTGSDADIWRYIATLPETQAAGLKLEVKSFTDSVSMNTAIANKEVDLNAFQAYSYLTAFNNSNPDKIAAVSTTYIEPMGIYSSKYKKIEELPEDAIIAIPDDAASESRALLLLQTAGLIKLKADFNPIHGSPIDVIENPKKINIKPIKMETVLRLKNEFDAVALNNTLALEGGLNVLKDSMFFEPIDQITKLSVNVLATAESRKNDPVLQKVGKLYHNAAVKKYVEEHFGGTKVDVDKPISYLSEAK